MSINISCSSALWEISCLATRVSDSMILYMKPRAAERENVVVFDWRFVQSRAEHTVSAVQCSDRTVQCTHRSIEQPSPPHRSHHNSSSPQPDSNITTVCRTVTTRPQIQIKSKLICLSCLHIMSEVSGNNSSVCESGSSPYCSCSEQCWVYFQKYLF